MKRTVAVALSAIVALSVVGAGVAVAQDSAPGSPAAYYGSVQDGDGNVAPAETTIVAVVNGQAEGEITIAEAGQYGGSNATDDKLRIDSGAGDTVTFHVGSVDGPQATDPGELALESGTQEVDLVFPAGTFTDNGSDSDSDDGSTGDTDETTTEDGDTTDEDDTTTGGGGGGGGDTSDESETTTKEDDSEAETVTATTQEDEGTQTTHTTAESDSQTATTASAADQTATDPTTPQPTDTRAPGFTMALALIALVAAALLALRMD